MLYLIATLLAVLLGVAVVIFRSRVQTQTALQMLRERVLDHPANQQLLSGLRRAELSMQLVSRDSLRSVTAADLKQFRNTVGQLYSPGDELFSILTKPLPLSCLYWLSASMALAHPETGVVFGLRIGTYLCLLRLPFAERDLAVAAGHAWAVHPQLKSIEIPTQFGPEWVIPNALTKQKDTLYLQAFDHSASLHDNR